MTSRAVKWLAGAGVAIGVVAGTPGTAQAAATGDCPKGTPAYNLTPVSTTQDSTVDARKAKYGRGDGLVCKRRRRNAVQVVQNSARPGRGTSSCTAAEFCAPAADSDGDGLSDAEEQTAGADGYVTNPLKRDTDNDGLSDGDEVNASGPLDTDGYTTDPTAKDTDQDGLRDGDEADYETNPHVYDSDGDGLSDGSEAQYYHTDPADIDTDNDGLTDGREVNPGTGNYLSDPNDVDTDDDSLDDGDEADYGSNPDVHDTDGGGVGDGVEVSFGQSPTDGSDDYDFTKDN